MQHARSMVQEKAETPLKPPNVPASWTQIEKKAIKILKNIICHVFMAQMQVIFSATIFIFKTVFRDRTA